MATAKTKIKPECAICYDEEASYACVRPAHDTYHPGAKIVPKSVLATAILQISAGVKDLEKTGLNRRAVVALLADDTKLGKGTINTVLNSLGDLAKNYTK